MIVHDGAPNAVGVDMRFYLQEFVHMRSGFNMRLGNNLPASVIFTN